MKYPTTSDDTGTGRRPMPPDATDDERKLAAVGVQFENGDVSRENVAWLLNHCADQGERLREAYECLIEAGFACLTADEIAEMTFSTSEEQARAANAVRGIFAKAYAEVMGRRSAK